MSLWPRAQPVPEPPATGDLAGVRVLLPSWVVIITTPGGRRDLSHASLLFEDEAHGEADAWRRMAYRADVRQVR